MSLWLRDQHCQKVLPLSCVVKLNLVRPLQVALKLKKSSWCKARLEIAWVWQKNAHQPTMSFSIQQQQCQLQHNHGYKLSFQNTNQIELLRKKDGMVWLIHFSSSTWQFEMNKVWCHGRYVPCTSQWWALWWRLAQMLCNQDSGCKVWMCRCSWCCWQTHIWTYTKEQIYFKCYKKTNRCSMELLAFIHTRRYTSTLTQMPSMCTLGLIRYLESIWRLSEWNLTILWELVS